MKRHEIVFSSIRLPIDVIVCLASFFVARELRESRWVADLLGVQYQTIQTAELLMFGLFGTLIFVLSLAIGRLYHVELSGSRLKEFGQVVEALVIGFFVYVGLIYFTNGVVYEIPIPRLLLLFAFFLCVLGTVMARVVLDIIQLYGLRKGWYARRKLLLILDKKSSVAIDDIKNSSLHDVVGYLGSADVDLPKLGEIHDLKKVSRMHQVNDVFCLTPRLTYEQESDVIKVVQNLGLTYRYLTHLSEVSHKNSDIQLLGDTPLVEIRSGGMTIWGRILKRFLDTLFALIGFILLLPFFVVLCVLIVRDSPGSPIFTQLRVGKSGRLFRIYKLRSMYKDAEKRKDAIRMENQRMDGPLFKIDDDPRITRFGKWMRRYSIDELPNLFNVINGDMSLIGPRPHLPDEVTNYKDDQKRVLTVKPGITGMAQVNGRHSNTFEREVELDIFYIEHWSLLLDAKIFVKTVRAMFGGK